MVADTSVFIEHERKLEDLDLAMFLAAGTRFQPVRLLVPIVVVDELDGLKNRASKAHARYRAGYTLAVLDRLLANGVGPAVLRPAEPPSSSDRPPRSEFSTEIVLDPPGHVRLPINDDDLIDRTLATQALAGRPVMLVTFDTGQSTRGRAAGLTVNKQTKPIGIFAGPARCGGLITARMC
jgi:predicted ribonuclease YlaK